MCIPRQIFHPVDERQLLSPEHQSSEKYDTTTITNTDALLAATTYLPNDTPHFTKFPPEQVTAVCYFLLFDFLRTPESNLGALRKLPLELLHQIIQDLPIQTLFRLRHVNARFREVVAALPLYKLMATHAVSSMLAFTRFELTSKTTLSTLYNVATSEKCYRCGELGLFIFMPTLQRCCNRCITSGSDDVSDLQVERITVAQRKVLARYENDSFRIVRSVPRAYPDDQRIYEGRKRATVNKKQWLVATNRVPKDTGVDLTPPKTDRDRYCLSYDLRYMCRVELPPLEVKGSRVKEQQGVSCKGCQSVWREEAARAWASRWPPNCGSPRKGMEMRRYSTRGFMEHFVWCKKAQGMWEDSRTMGNEEIGKEDEEIGKGDVVNIIPQATVEVGVAA
ncbi:hypothetical protein B0T16DRAFT_453449 [Cercophora newfieldiana]|uniref:F-box domain-containing protein n=1 Tax=Cercophora newfieldiana TaxID=92897 RepID=A0AA39YTS8_9PEZI|nr:hypothetical protein B0T16DRAFT_453449 [Cercophora newfieldiana]